MALGFADEIRKLAENISTSYNVRIGGVKDIIKDTQSTLKNFHTDRQEMSAEQRAELSHFTKQLSDAVQNMAQETKKMMNEMAKAHKEMAQNLRGNLNKFHNSLSKETQGMLNGFKNNMKALANDFHNAHQAWLRLSCSMAEAKKGMKQIPKAEICEETPKIRKRHSRKR